MSSVQISIEKDGCGMDENSTNTAFTDAYEGFCESAGSIVKFSTALIQGGFDASNPDALKIIEEKSAQIKTLIDSLISLAENSSQKISEDTTAPPDEEITEFKQFYGAKVLICEDNDINQEVAAMLLETVGIIPDIASNGREGIEFLERQQYHMIFMDVLMPEMDGCEATSIIRGGGKPYKDIPIVAMTGNVEKEEIEKCISCGMNAHVGKPIDITSLYPMLIKYLPKGTFEKNTDVSETEKKESSAVSEIAEVTEYPDIIDGIDINQGTARFGGKREKYFMSLAKFAEELPESFESFESFASDEKHEESCQYIHMLKGVSGNLAVNNIYDITVRLETRLKSKLLDKDTYVKWSESCANVKSMLVAVLPGKKEDKPLEAGTEKEFSLILTGLGDALERYASSECDQYTSQLKNKSFAFVSADDLRNLLIHIDNFDYDPALELVEKFMTAQGSL